MRPGFLNLIFCILSVACVNDSQPNYILYDELLPFRYGSYLLAPEGHEIYICKKGFIRGNINDYHESEKDGLSDYELEKIGVKFMNKEFVRIQRGMFDSLVDHSTKYAIYRSLDHLDCKAKNGFDPTNDNIAPIDLSQEVERFTRFNFVGHFEIPELTLYFDDDAYEAIINLAQLPTNMRIIGFHQLGKSFGVLIGIKDTTGMTQLTYPTKWTAVEVLKELHLCPIN